MSSNIPSPPSDLINRPNHYNSHPTGVTCYSIVEHYPYHIATAMAYLWRADLKNGEEDIQKAIWHLKRELAMREEFRDAP